MVDIAEIKPLLNALGFAPEEGSAAIWAKIYSNHYKIKVNFDEQEIDYGNKIIIANKATCNFKASENFVVLECVNRLLEKGYQPKNIILEKTWVTGHGTSGKLDVLVTHHNGVPYLMIECKTYGSEFDKELKRVLKDGGQLFTYFQQDKNADVLMLYASQVNKGKIQYRNEIVNIEDDYRQTGNVKDFYDRWNKLPKNNGIFDEWVKAYAFESKALTPKNLKEIKQEDSSFIFNQFLEILRHNVVSDKPNAFNKIFTLFLCKIYDEKSTGENDELAFQWFYSPYQYEGISYPPDDNISFQKRLTDLYKKGMREFLDKEVTDISDADFEKKYGGIDSKIRQKILDDIVEIRLKKNNEFAIKEVFDDSSFEENAKVVKQVVELLQGYKIRYTKKQQYLSDFFEMLLTTGLKQESGQFFTPVPIAQFIIKSIPLDKIVKEKLNKGEKDNLLPTIIDYAAGSGHFITESMHEIQRIINATDPKTYISDTAKKLKSWKEDHFEWAIKYVYGIEKDYRLVKVGKVGCYLHGDGLAQIIHSDGLGNFKKTEEYKELLKKTDKDDVRENKQFDIVISNPPYSVSAFKNNARKYYTEEDFEIYSSLTDQSSEIECLFIERTKQLLKDGGIAGIILPSSILSNAGIYTKAREILLQYFEIIAIAEFGGNTFMATGTNTVTLFMRRRNNYDCKNIRSAVADSLLYKKDVTLNKIEKPISKYVNHVWEGITYNDYITLLQKQPNEAVEKNEIYKEYRKKIKAKNEKEFWDNVIKLEQEKIFYFVLAYPQKVILVNSGEKSDEKKFLGYEFSNRRGNEGIHPIHGGKSIDECTQLFDPEIFDNPLRVSTYIYQAFQGNFDSEIHESLKKNIVRLDLADMLTFNRVDFEKNISLASKKKVKIESKWELVKIGDVTEILNGGTPDTKNANYWNGDINWATLVDTKSKYLYATAKKITLEGVKKSSAVILPLNTVVFSSRATIGNVCITKVETCTNQGYKNFVCSDKIHCEYLYLILKDQADNIAALASGMTYPEISKAQLSEYKIPLPPEEVQEKIVAEVNKIETSENKVKEKIAALKEKIIALYIQATSAVPQVILSGKIEIIGGGTPNTNNPEYWNGDIPWLSIADFKSDNRFVSDTEKKITEKGLKNSSAKFLNKGDLIISARGTVGALAQLTKPMAFNQSCYGIRAKDSLSNDYLYYALKFEIEQFKHNAYGAIFDSVTTKTFDLIKIPLPPLKEQHKIVSQLETVENQIADLEKELTHLTGEKGTILKKYL